MRTLKLSLLILSMLPLAAHADSWLCISEFGAYVGDKDGKVVGADSFADTGQKWLVDDNGFREFGSDDIIFARCTIAKGRPTWCDRTSGAFNGFFSMDVENVFSSVQFREQDDGESRIYVIKGKCSKISD